MYTTDHIYILFLFLCIQIVDVETKEFLFYINATDPRRCNWMRYINCARYFEEQNILSEQDGIDIFYQAIKVRLERLSTLFCWWWWV